MVSFRAAVRDASAAGFRRLPEFRGLGRTWRFINRALLALGAAPVVTAPMRDGTVMRVDLRTRTEPVAFYRGQYERELIDTVLSLYDADGVFLDIGANIGFYSVAIAASLRRRCGAGRVWSFEPLTANCARLRENLTLNDLHAWCRVFEFGLSDRARDAPLTLREDFADGGETGNASVAISDAFDEGFPTARAEFRTLDDVVVRESVNARTIIDCVKIDVEGHEDFCLRGAVQTLAMQRPAVLMEVNKPYYRARGVDPDVQILPLLPANYAIFRSGPTGWRRIPALAACRSFDNVFLIPVERLTRPVYRAAFGGAHRCAA